MGEILMGNNLQWKIELLVYFLMLIRNIVLVLHIIIPQYFMFKLTSTLRICLALLLIKLWYYIEQRNYYPQILAKLCRTLNYQRKKVLRHVLFSAPIKFASIADSTIEKPVKN
jgi:hypothetical protein